MRGVFKTKMVFKKISFLSVFLLFLFVSFNNTVFAQTVNAELDAIIKQIQEAVASGASQAEIDALQEKLFNAQISQSVETKITPEYYGPNEDIEIKIISYSTDLRRAKITWSSGGETLSSGTGITTYTTKTKGVGERISLSVTIKTYEGLIFTKNISLVPIDLELQWEASTYTPPFYKGKALPTPKSKIKIVALPGFVDASKKEVSSDTLVYTWRSYNRTVLSEGYGKNSAYTQSPEWVGVERPVYIEVSTLNSSLSSKKRFFIKSYSPIVMLYEESPILGILYNHTLKEKVVLLSDEMVVKGEPFFFSQSLKTSDSLMFEWLQNGNTVLNKNSSSIVLRREGETTGSSRINLSVKNQKNAFEGASRSFMLHFGK